MHALDSNENEGGILYRPPQSYLDVFWLLSDGAEEDVRNAGALKLSEMLCNAEKKEKSAVLEYCRDRLIRGLSSGRKFARVGFSVALTQLLRDHESLSNADVMQAIKKKLKIQGEKNSKAEAGGIYLGKAFAFSSLIQSGRIGQLSNDDIRTMVEELLTFGQKKSYMKPICFSIIEDLVKQISVDTFGDSVWSRIRDPVKEGWQGCTLDKLSLLLACREMFPDVVNKKFLKKHWGFPILSEENDEHLLKVILGTETQRTEILVKRILPCLRQLDRSILSIWKGVGDPMMNKESVKKAETLLQRQIVGLKFAYALLISTSNKDQVLDLLLSPSLASAVFHSITLKNDPLGKEGNVLFEALHQKVKEEGLKVQGLVVRLWSLSGEQSEANSVRDMITSHNFTRLVDLMDKEESAAFAETLIAAVNGTSEVIELSSNEAVRRRQIESCLRCLHHIVCNQNVTSPDLQKSVLTLFVRLGFFCILKKNEEIQHCNTTINLEQGKTDQKLCKVLFFKILDQLSTMGGGSHKKSNHLDGYVSLLFEVAKYFQSLLKRKNISLMESYPEQLIHQWDEVFTVVSKIQETSVDSRSSKDRAFFLLFLFLTFQMLNDFKTSLELLEEVHLCYKKADKPTQNGDSEDEKEPAWQEVLTEVVLNLMSLQSHLARVVSSAVLASLAPYLTIPAVRLITEVLIPKSGRGDDAGGVMVESKEGDEESDDNDSLIDEDIADEESEENSDEDEEEDDDEESEEEQNEEMEIDEKFRASVQEALGAAAVKENGVDGETNDEELSDLSDSEMFKLDDMLAEVFRQKKKMSDGKKKQEERKKELYTFRIRVLDLMEVLVKSDKCGDFVLELLQPLLLVMKNDSKENQAMISKSRSILKQLKLKTQSLVDSLHTSEEQKVFVTDLLELTQNLADTSKVQDVSLACHIAMKLSYDEEKEPGHKCNEVIETSVLQMITKGKSKPHPSFFSNLIGHNVGRYQFMYPMLASCLKDPAIKLHGKMICCSMLSSLMKKTQKKSESEDETIGLIQEVASTVSKLIATLQADNMKVMFTRELLSLAVALQNRDDVFRQSPFDQAELQKMIEIKPKLNTDLRKLANRFSAGIMRKNSNKTTSKKKIGKGKAVESKRKQKKKRRQSDVNDEVNEPSSKKPKH